MVANSSGFEQVGNDNTLTTHTQTNLSTAKNGFLYIYLSNETPNIDVFFDNLTVSHIRGPILEETHYYPFGLTMAGISSKALAFGEPGNIIKFQNQEFASKEFSDGNGLDMYEFKWRMHDPQIGRFWQVDPLAEEYVYNSTYAFSENKVIAHVELEGLEAVIAITNKQVLKKIQQNASSTTNESERLVWAAVGKGDATFTPDFRGREGFLAVDDKGSALLSVSDGIVRGTPKDAWVENGIDGEILSNLSIQIGLINSEISKGENNINRLKSEIEIIEKTQMGSDQGDPRQGVIVSSLIRKHIKEKNIKKEEAKIESQKNKRTELQSRLQELININDEAKKKSNNIVNY